MIIESVSQNHITFSAVTRADLHRLLLCVDELSPAKVRGICKASVTFIHEDLTRAIDTVNTSSNLPGRLQRDFLDGHGSGLPAVGEADQPSLFGGSEWQGSDDPAQAEDEAGPSGK